jgi:hypothetical protein
MTVGFVNYNPDAISYTNDCNDQHTEESDLAPVTLYPPGLTMQLVDGEVVNGNAPYGFGSGTGTITYTWTLHACPGGLCPVQP